MKIGFFVVARLKSSRLRLKLLLGLNGKSVIDRVIERCKLVRGLDGVVLCTSLNPQDSLLYRRALDHQIEFYPGSESDVLERLRDAAQYFGYDAALVITADNPLFCLQVCHLMVDWYRRDPCDFITARDSLPLGMSPYFVDFRAVEIAVCAKQVTETEMWGHLVNDPELFRVGKLTIRNSPYGPDKRLTLDYPEDYRLLAEVVSHFPSGYQPSTNEIFGVLGRHSDLWAINSGCYQAQLPADVLEATQRDAPARRERAVLRAESMGKRLRPGLESTQADL